MQFNLLSTAVLLGGLGVLVAVVFLWMVFLRRVVSTNEVHIVQSSKKTISYGKEHATGNVYYEWPSWLPVFGVTVIRLPVSVFNIRLDNYEAYDQGRLPFVLDMEAFFRVEDSAMAAQRVVNIEDLRSQLKSILQGAARAILASKTIEDIMQGRAEFGDAFTKEVNEQLKAWGVTTVKNIELMDIRDSSSSKVIANIMEKKKSEIERESRITVAGNMQAAQEAEIAAQREVEVKKQEALQAVGIRTAEKDKQVGIAAEQSAQEVKTQQKVTAEKDMEVSRVQEVKAAEIARDKAIVKAEETKRTAIINAEGEKQRVTLEAEGQLEAEKRNAEAVLVNGQSAAEAKKLLELAPVQAQIVLAQEIGENQGYQNYLVTIRQVEAMEQIGVAQAAALQAADIKVIANGRAAADGLSSVGELISSSGGTKLGAMLEGLAQTDAGQAIMAAVAKNVTPKK